MNFHEFFAKWNGKTVDIDGAYGSQCVDLMRQYCEEVLKVGKYALPRGNAKEIFPKTPSTHPDFIKIPNRPWNFPRQGDIIFWGSDIGPFGHVAIVNTAGLMKLTSIDQNWPPDKKIRLVEHSYKGCLGWLRKR